MKKVLAIVLCVCIAFTLSLTVMAESSPQNTVIIRKGVGTKQDGTSVSQDTFTEVSEDDTITIKANEKTYGKFNKWTIYVVREDPTTGELEYAEAKEGVDYIIVDGSLEDDELVVKPISQIAVAGDYNDKTTDPAKEGAANPVVTIQSGNGKTSDGKDVESDTTVELGEDGTITVSADEDNYGKFDKWVIYVVDEDGNQKEAEEGVDYLIIDGSLTESPLTIKPINEIIIDGEYEGEEPVEPEEGVGQIAVQKAKAAFADGTSIPENTFVVAKDTATVEANEEKYGKFDSFSVYAIIDVVQNGSNIDGTAKILNLTSTEKAVAAEAGVDYEIVSGNSKTKKMSINVLADHKIVVCGNYDGNITDPLSPSTIDDKEDAEDINDDDNKGDDGKETSPKTGDVEVMYALFALIAAGAVVFGVKRQFSK